MQSSNCALLYREKSQGVTRVDAGRAAGSPAGEVSLAKDQSPNRASRQGNGTVNCAPAPGRHGQRWILVLGVVVFAVSVAAWSIWHVASFSQPSSMLDLQIYRWGGLIARHSGDLYGDHFPYYHLRFTYTPAAALVFAAMSAVPVLALRLFFAFVSIASLAAALWLTWGLLGYRRTAGRAGAALGAAGIALWLGPVQQTLGLGQVNVMLMLIILADLSLPDDAWPKGIGVGLAAGFKLTPLIFIAYLLLTRRLRAAAVSLGTFALTITGSLILLPSQARQYWFDGLFLDSNRTGNNAYVGNQSLHGALARLVGDTSASELRWAAVPVLVGIAGLVLAAWWSRRGYEMIGILTCALTGLLVSPISWDHHWVWAAPALLVAVEIAAGLQTSLKSRWRWAAWPCLAVLAAPFFTVPQNLVHARVVQGHGAQGIQLLTGNLYVITGLIVLGLAGFGLMAPDRHPECPQSWDRPLPRAGGERAWVADPD